MTPKDRDAFFTRPAVARACMSAFREWIAQCNINADTALFLEPSAGSGAFYDLLPANRRYGIDIVPMHADIHAADFMHWTPPKHWPRNIITIGNPPFGKRGKLALSFLHRAANFSSIIGMITPVGISINHMTLLHSLMLDRHSFTLPDGAPFATPSIFQIWCKPEFAPPRTKTTFSLEHPPQLSPHYICDIRYDGTTRGMQYINQCDVFINRKSYDGSAIKAVRHFQDIPPTGKHGARECYGLRLAGNSRSIEQALNFDWSAYATHNMGAGQSLNIKQVQKALNDIFSRHI